MTIEPADDPAQQTNLDPKVVAGFGAEWSRFDQSSHEIDEDLRHAFQGYFRHFPWEMVSAESRGFDLGCGSGRWAKFVAPRCAHLLLIDPSEDALSVARSNLARQSNVEFLVGSAGSLPLSDDAFDFGYCLGVLHHTPDPLAGLKDAVRVLKPGAPLLIYLYYAFDNRAAWFRVLWRFSNGIRVAISRLPRPIRHAACDALALLVYWPFARLASVASRLGVDTSSFPLSAYRDKSFYIMRTDSLDRFGTRLERRFTRREVAQLMTDAGLEDVSVPDEFPYWTAIGTKSRRKHVR